MITATKPQRVQLVAGGLVAAAVVWPLLPVHPSIPCPLFTTTGVPCPLCGMTRASVALAHGNVVDALSFNPGVIVLVALVATALVRPERFLKVKPPVWMLGIGLGLLWLWNVGFNPTFSQWFL